MIMIMLVKSLVGISFVAALQAPSAGSAVRIHDLDPLPANRRLSSIDTTTNTNTFVYTFRRHICTVFAPLTADFFVLVFGVSVSILTYYRHLSLSWFSRLFTLDQSSSRSR
jgi:hypothetical protein